MKMTAIAVGHDSTPTIFGLSEEDGKVYIWDATQATWRLHQAV